MSHADRFHHARNANPFHDRSHQPAAPPVADTPPAPRPSASDAPPSHPASIIFTRVGRSRLSDQQMLDALRACARHHRGPFTREAFNRWPHRPCCAAAIRHRFKSWNRALSLARVPRMRFTRYDPQQLVDHLRAVWLVRGRAPGINTLHTHGPISVGPYIRHWGSLRRACLQLARFEQGAITKEALLAGGGAKIWRRVPPGLRWQVLERDRFRCTACGSCARRSHLEVDHIIPRSRGGSDDLSNLRTLCRQCNRGRGDKAPPKPTRRRG